MQFVIICLLSLLGLGIVAAVASMATGECKIGCLLEEKRRKEQQKES